MFKLCCHHCATGFTVKITAIAGLYQPIPLKSYQTIARCIKSDLTRNEKCIQNAQGMHKHNYKKQNEVQTYVLYVRTYVLANGKII